MAELAPGALLFEFCYLADEGFEPGKTGNGVQVIRIDQGVDFGGGVAVKDTDHAGRDNLCQVCLDLDGIAGGAEGDPVSLRYAPFPRILRVYVDHGIRAKTPGPGDTKIP